MLNAATNISKTISTVCFNITLALEEQLAPQGVRLWFTHCMEPLRFVGWVCGAVYKSEVQQRNTSTLQLVNIFVRGRLKLKKNNY